MREMKIAQNRGRETSNGACAPPSPGPARLSLVSGAVLLTVDKSEAGWDKVDSRRSDVEDCLRASPVEGSVGVGECIWVSEWSLIPQRGVWVVRADYVPASPTLSWLLALYSCRR